MVSSKAVSLVSIKEKKKKKGKYIRSSSQLLKAQEFSLRT